LAPACPRSMAKNRIIAGETVLRYSLATPISVQKFSKLSRLQRNIRRLLKKPLTPAFNFAIYTRLREGRARSGRRCDSPFRRGDTRSLFTDAERAKIPPQILDKIVHAMFSSITHIFLLALIPLTFAMVAVLLMGRIGFSPCIWQRACG